MIRLFGKTVGSFVNSKFITIRPAKLSTPVTSFCFIRERSNDVGHTDAAVPMCFDSTPTVHSKGASTSVYPMVYHTRNYAKRSNHAKKESAKISSKKQDKPHVELSDEELNEIIDFGKLKNQMDLTLTHLQKEYTEQLAVRVSIGMISGIVVDTTDGLIPLNQLGQVFQKTPQLIMVNLIDSPQHINSVRKAIEDSGININPQQEGTTLFLPIPKVTKEHRENLAKNAKILCEKTKDKLRNIQNGYVRDLKKAKEVHSADLIHNLNETILVTTKTFMEKAEEMMAAKQKELLGSS